MAGTVRELIADQIKADSPSYAVKPYAAAKPEVERPTVFVYREALNNSPQTASVGHDIKVALMVPGLPSEANENALEDLLHAVLVSINSLDFTLWSRAERTTFFDNWMGYEITVQANTNNIYKPSA
ncbi:hypothetical protein [Arthrobacter sp. 31Y]|uniref:hypothetical protein n=1 Tax=Arthrobacter sp. 31Y TaxID=1115632 RepID=UPI000464D34D|nr:hypothetical protein [Arthrobacter sp. 31Y]